MAKKRKVKKAKKTAAGYIEKISTQISDRIKKELGKSFKIAPSDSIKKIKKILPKLKKQIETKLKNELKKSFKMMPAGGKKKAKKKK